jgi:hypothetical protein
VKKNSALTKRASLVTSPGENFIQCYK